MNSFFFGLGCVAGALVFSTFESSATVGPTVAFSTLDAGGGYSSVYGITISGSHPPYTYQGYGNEFVPTVSGQLDNIGIAISYINQPESVNVQIRLDNGIGFPTGPILASGSVMTDGLFGSSSTALSTFSPSSPVFLTAGTGYWLLLTPTSNSSFDSWNDESVGLLGNHAGTSDGSTWGIGDNQPLNAFQVIVDVPEPSTMALALAGGLGLVCLRRLKLRVIA